MCTVLFPVVRYILPSGATEANPNKVDNGEQRGQFGGTETNESYVATVSCEAGIFEAVKSNW